MTTDRQTPDSKATQIAAQRACISTLGEQGLTKTRTNVSTACPAVEPILMGEPLYEFLRDTDGDGTVRETLQAARPRCSSFALAHLLRREAIDHPIPWRKWTNRARLPMSEQARKRRVRRILRQLDRDHPNAECALRDSSAWDLLAATILSAQWPAARINKVTPEPFGACPTVANVAAAPWESIEGLIRTNGFFRNKAKSLKGAAQRIVSEHKGRVPSCMEHLLTLPGVVRKTANVVTGTRHSRKFAHILARNIPAGDARTTRAGKDPMAMPDVLSELQGSTWNT